jgi:16S rRNA (uracil1498-N3)-methyltransferase
VRLAIAQAIPKGQKMDLIVEKATELGAAAIVPLRSDRVVGERTGDHKIERWQRLAKTAAQQCGRSVIPTVAAIASWDELLATFPSYDRVYIPWELADVQPLRATFEADAPHIASALFVIGPEGGFSSHEVERAIAAGAVAISLGTRILRTETVALVVLAAFAYARGEL